MGKEKINIVAEMDEGFEAAYHEARKILVDAKNRAWQAVNAEMVPAYWHVGRIIVDQEQSGQSRAEYGAKVIQTFSERLTNDLGKGHRPSNLWNMKAFYLTYPKLHAVRGELSWTHYRLLLKVEKPEARAFYENEAINARWSTREMDRQINSLLFERLALSKDKEGVKALAHKGHEIYQPADLVKDPYVLEFTGIPESTKFLESDLESALIQKLRHFLLELGKGFAFMGRQ